MGREEAVTFEAKRRELSGRLVGSTVDCNCPGCVERVPCTVLSIAIKWQNWKVRCTRCGREFHRCEQVHPGRRLSDEEKRRRKNAYSVKRQREKAKDPEWRAKRRERDRKRYAAMDLEKKAAYLARHAEYNREYRKGHPEKWAYVPVSELTPDELEHRRNVENAKRRRYGQAHPGYNSEKAKLYRERHPEHREKARAAYHEMMAFMEKRPKALARFKAEKKAYDAAYRKRKKEEMEASDGLGQG